MSYLGDSATIQQADEEAAYFQEKYGEQIGELMQGERPDDTDDLPY